MRAIEPTTRFRKDFKREKSGQFGRKLDVLVQETVAMLAADQPLPPRFVDHPLAGEWKDYRDCHIRPDLILIYRLVGTDTLELARLGSHSELGL